MDYNYTPTIARAVIVASLLAIPYILSLDFLASRAKAKRPFSFMQATILMTALSTLLPVLFAPLSVKKYSHLLRSFNDDNTLIFATLITGLFAILSLPTFVYYKWGKAKTDTPHQFLIKDDTPIFIGFVMILFILVCTAGIFSFWEPLRPVFTPESIGCITFQATAKSLFAFVSLTLFALVCAAGILTFQDPPIAHNYTISEPVFQP